MVSRRAQKPVGTSRYKDGVGIPSREGHLAGIHLHSTEKSTVERPTPARTPTEPRTFRIALEVDLHLVDLTPDRRDELINSAPLDATHIHDTVYLDESALGNAVVSFESEHTDWTKAGLQALDVARAVGNTWPVAGVEVCRSDLWLYEPFFDHEPDGLGHLPEWSSNADPHRCSTVIIEVEPENATTRYLRDDQLTQVLNDRRNVRLSRSSNGRPQLILETKGSPTTAGLSIAKPSITLDRQRTITRVRSVRADIYRSEVALYDVDVPEVEQPRFPEWRYVTDDGDRTVVVTDLRVRLEGWSIIHTSVDGITDTSDFGFGAVWRDDDGNLNAVCDGDILDAWEAPIPRGSNLDAFVVDGTRLDVDPWDAMTEWLAESMYDQPLGFLIELGPQAYDESDDGPVVCAQVVFLSGGVLMLRRSREVLERLSFADYSSDGLAIDTWHYDRYFDDCTDGYLFTRDIRLVAQTCTSWFRDKSGFDTADALGCSYRTADELPRTS